MMREATYPSSTISSFIAGATSETGGGSEVPSSVAATAEGDLTTSPGDLDTT
eukprot:CAMPEP_0173255402 /NCGR_PEP_ID=MMETSP1142-20121109/22513_1 /TAXON_ID=483371 /ORGANISM="non described non described, Strain CCMP2298" /LENGTH=51 /DNA_ID=CAMNT_0014189053 /DNA_START=94 /DNA_END=249 /DNA_ORIENTATION=-